MIYIYYVLRCGQDPAFQCIFFRYGLESWDFSLYFSCPKRSMIYIYYVLRFGQENNIENRTRISKNTNEIPHKENNIGTHIENMRIS
jgi:hypothetical protein